MRPFQRNLRIAFRYIIYSLLALNIVWFSRAELAASSALLEPATDWTTLLSAFSETLDTLAWVALILLFELEINVLSAERLQGRLKWLLSGLRIVCYTMIVSSLYGYWAMWQMVTSMDATGVADACALADQGYSYLAGLDLYPALTSANCQSFVNVPLQLISGTRIVATPAQLQAAGQEAVVDLINAATWLVVVIIMEAEIYLQLLGSAGASLRQRWLGISKRLLAPLYLVLLGCAIYWLLNSDLLDFWDALLWLIAFAFIELNILDWQTNSNDHANPSATTSGSL